MALGETVGACIASPGKWCVSGASGCRGVIVAARSHGSASTNFWPGTRCRQPGSCTASPPRANLSREEPDAGNSHVRHCEGWGPVTTPPTRPGATASNGLNIDRVEAETVITAIGADIEPGRTTP